uniref:Uncharacterized protein n=1 Tax=Arundo donax TaxID=35708 RepID=A0A0A9EUK8_ARUDO
MERQVEIANRARKKVSKQLVDNMVHTEHALADHSDQVTMPHATYGGEECLQQTNGSVAKHSKRQSGHLIGTRNINVEERYVEPMKPVIQEAEEQTADYISHTTQMHVGPPNDGVFWHGNKTIGSGAELSSSCDTQKWTMPTEQLISEEQEHTHAIDATQTEHIEADTRKKAPGRTSKRKKKGLMISSNNGLQLRRHKRLAPESDAVVDSGPLQIESPEQQAASPYQNLSDLPDIDGNIATLCLSPSPQLKMPQLRSTELETLHLATSRCSHPYSESHNEIIVGHDMHEIRSEVEPRLVYKGQGKTGPSKLCVPIEQELEHPSGNIRTEQDEVEMGQQTVRLTHKRTKRSLMPSSNEGFEHRRSKHLSKQSTAVTYYESAESESEEHQAASPSKIVSYSPDNDQVNDDISSSSLPQHDMPQRSSNEADNLHTTQSASSIPDMSDPESFLVITVKYTLQKLEGPLKGVLLYGLNISYIRTRLVTCMLVGRKRKDAVMVVLSASKSGPCLRV